MPVDPVIVRLKASGTGLEITEAIPVITAGGGPVTGLFDQDGRDERSAAHPAAAAVRLEQPRRRGAGADEPSAPPR